MHETAAKDRRTDRDDRTDDDQRVYPAESAWGPRRRTPAWKRIEPGLSAGYAEIHRALHAADGLSPEEVTSS